MKTNIKKSFFLLLMIVINFIIILGVEIAQAYNPPIGIPDPGMWGTTHPIDSVAPDTATKCPAWPSTQTTNCYYIDIKHPQATDTNNSYGYPNKPRLTIPAITYLAGSYIELHGGPYTSNVSMSMKGTEENPVWFRGVSSSLAPDIRAKFSISDSKYTIFENLDFNNFAGNVMTIKGMSTNNICVRNSNFHDMIYPGSSSSVVASVPSQGGTLHDIVFYNNNFSDIGDWQAVKDDDYHAIGSSLWGRTPPTTQYNVWVLNNTGYHISGNLVQFNGDQRDVQRAINENRTETNLDNFHHMYVGFNYSSYCRQSLASTKLTTDIIVSQNESHDNYGKSSDSGNGEVFQEGPNYLRIIFNKYYNEDFGIRQSNMSHKQFANQKTFMIGNVLYNMYKNTKSYTRNNRYKPAQGIAFEKGNHQRYIVDNTIFDVGGGISISMGKTTDFIEISGNIIAGVNGIDDRGDNDFHISRLDSTGKITLNNNFFQPRKDNGKVTFIWSGISPSIKNSLTEFKKETKQCQNCIEGDPLFIDTTNYNLHPKSNSPLIGKGVRNSVYDEFKARYGISIDYDFDGNPRPINGPRTIGAFEYIESTSGKGIIEPTRGASINEPTKDTSIIEQQIIKTNKYIKQYIISKLRLSKTIKGRIYINIIDNFVNIRKDEELILVYKEIGLLKERMDLKTKIKYENIFDYLEASIVIKLGK